MSKHTPGPWYVSKGRTEEHCHVLAITTQEGAEVDAICVVDKLPADERSRANARLIAAAPDLLKALQLITEVGDRAATEIAHAAIAKATGDAT